MDHVQREQYCMTPPLYKSDPGTITPDCQTPLVTSPLTPYSTIESQPWIALTDSEKDTLDMMLQRSYHHWKGEKQLFSNIKAVGNGLYLIDRPIIVEWMTEVCSSFLFQQVTLHVAVRHMDWFMSKQPLRKHSWQLCAVASLLIAAKSEEAGTKVPEMHSLRHICGGAFSEELIRCMELCILNCLDWDVVTKTAVHFTDHFMSIIYRMADQGLLTKDGPVLPSPIMQSSPINLNSRTAMLLDFASDDESDQDSTYEPEDDDMYISDDEFEDDDLPDIDDNILFTTTKPCRAFPDPRLRSSIETFHRTAKCALDLSLYDFSFRYKFSPNVIAAAALSVACDATTGFCLTNRDITVITGVSDRELCDCHHILWKKFQVLQH